jgi:hypothetical protein
LRTALLAASPPPPPTESSGLCPSPSTNRVNAAFPQPPPFHAWARVSLFDAAAPSAASDISGGRRSSLEEERGSWMGQERGHGAIPVGGSFTVDGSAAESHGVASSGEVDGYDPAPALPLSQLRCGAKRSGEMRCERRKKKKGHRWRPHTAMRAPSKP